MSAHRTTLRAGRSLPVLIAASLCYIWGAVLLLVSVASALPMVSRHAFALAGAVFPFIVLIIGVTYCVTGRLIGQRRRFGAWLGAAVATLTALLQFVLHLYIMWISLTPAWLVIDALVLVLLLTNWRHFDHGAPHVAA